MQVSYHGRHRSRLGRKGEAIFDVEEYDDWVFVLDDNYQKHGIKRAVAKCFIGEPDSDMEIRWVCNGN